MESGAQQSGTSNGTSDAARAALTEFLADNEAHISALESAARDRLSKVDQSGPSPRGVQITVTVGADDAFSKAPSATFEETGPASECWEASYICGKGASGYMYCKKTVCIEVEPVQ